MWLLVGIAACMVPIAWNLTPHRLRPGDRTEVASLA
jgi:hypothetical protein